MSSNQTKFVYLAGPIAKCTVDEAKEWRKDVIFALPKDIVGISPLRSEPDPDTKTYELGFECPKFGTPGAIAAKNMYDVKTCDLILARLPKEINARRPSYGTFIEIAWGIYLNKPVVIWTDDEYVKNHPLVSFYVPWIVPDMQSAIEIIKGLFKYYV